MRFRWLIPLCLPAVVGASAYLYFRRDLPHTARSALRNAEQFELLSINPLKQTSLRSGLSLEKFHNHEILGRTTITDPTARQQLSDALRSAARQSDGSVMACFMPRHGIRVTRSGQFPRLADAASLRAFRVLHRNLSICSLRRFAAKPSTLDSPPPSLTLARFTARPGGTIS